MRNDQEIGIVISAEDLTADAINSAKKNATDLATNWTDMGDKGFSAFKGVGFVAKDMFHELGVGGPVARYLGHEVMDLAFTLGNVGTAFGGAAIAGMVMYKVYQHLADIEKEKAEAIDRSVKSLESEVTALYANSERNDAVTKATYNMIVAKKALLALDLATQIETDTKALDKLATTYETDMKRLASPSTAFVGWTQQDYQAAVKREAIELQIAKDTLEKKKALLAQYEGKTPTYGEFSGMGVDDSELKAQEKRVADYYANIQALRNKSYYAEEKETKDEQKLRVDDWNFTLTMLAKKTAYTQKARELEIAEAEVAANELVKIDQARYKVQSELQAASIQTLSNAMNAYADSTDKNAKTIFYLQKALAVAQIWVDTSRAAMSAAATAAVGGPYAAAAAAASMWYLGYANMAIVAATALFGSNSSGGSSAGSYAVSSGSTSSSNTPAAATTNSQNITVIINNPMSDQNWDSITEQQIVPALSRAAGRNVTVQY